MNLTVLLVLLPLRGLSLSAQPSEPGREEFDPRNPPRETVQNTASPEASCGEVDAADSSPRFRTLRVEKSALPGGGEFLRLDDRFRIHTVLVRGADGQMTIRSVQGPLDQIRLEVRQADAAGQHGSPRRGGNQLTESSGEGE